MTIKTKLIANMLLTAAIMAGVYLTSYSSLRFLQDKLLYIAEKSTPFQMGTVEFQRDLQSCITGLLKVGSARTIPEYNKFRGEAEISLENSKKALLNLKKMSPDIRMEVSDELNRISGELFRAAESRINSDIAAGVANAKVAQQMKQATNRLKELDTHIRALQEVRFAAFAKALENTGRFSARLRDLEDLRNQVKELVMISASANNAQIPTAFVIAKGRVKTLLARIAKNNSVTLVSSDLMMLSDDVNEFLELKSDAITKKDEESKRWAVESYIELSEMLNRMTLTLNQEIELASSKLFIENERQGIIFDQSNRANSVQSANSELVALGLAVSSEINRLFTLDSAEDVDKYTSQILSIFAVIHERAGSVEKSLDKIGDQADLAAIHSAHASLETIRSEIHSDGGISATLKKKLNAIEQSNIQADKLQAMAVKQSLKANDSVLVAQDEQKESIAAANNMVDRSLSAISNISLIATAIAILFGFWIYRSVLPPLRVVLDAVLTQQKLGKEKALLAETVASGDLNQEVTISEAIAFDRTRIYNDEMGKVLKAIAGMSTVQVSLDRAFARMTASLRGSRDQETRRDRLKSGINELNNILREEQDTARLTGRALAFMATFIGAGVGIMYLYNDRNKLLKTISTYAVSKSRELNCEVKVGEGLAGQVALEQKMICLNNVPPDYLQITSALGEAEPLHVAILPIMHNDILIGVIELGSFRQFSNDDFDFLNPALEGIAISISVNRSHQKVGELLEETQQQAEELRVRQEELQQSNEEMEERARILAEKRNYNIY